MNKKISLGAALALMLIVTAVTFSITMIFPAKPFPPLLPTFPSGKQCMISWRR